MKAGKPHILIGRLDAEDRTIYISKRKQSTNKSTCIADKSWSSLHEAMDENNKVAATRRVNDIFEKDRSPSRLPISGRRHHRTVTGSTTALIHQWAMYWRPNNPGGSLLTIPYLRIQYCFARYVWKLPTRYRCGSKFGTLPCDLQT